MTFAAIPPKNDWVCWWRETEDAPIQFIAAPTKERAQRIRERYETAKIAYESGVETRAEFVARFERARKGSMQ